MCGKWEKYKIYFANSREERVVSCKNKTAFEVSITHWPKLENEKKKIWLIKECSVILNINTRKKLMIIVNLQIKFENVIQKCQFVTPCCNRIIDSLTN